MKRINILIFIFGTCAFAQNVESLLKTDFAIRDFITVNDSVYFIEKRDVHILDSKKNKKFKYFIGGYGLEMELINNNSVLVTASNELVKNISSVRFFNTKNNRPENTYFYKKGKILDFVLIPELKLFVLSLTNKKIIVVNYQERPKFHKTIEINIEAIARKMIYKDNSLYFSTDKGEIYKYNFRDYKKTRLYNSKELITDFLIDKERLIISTINGKLQSVNLNTFSSSNLTFNDNFINVLVFYNHEKLICGTWTGKIFIVDLNSFSVKNEFSFHKRSILCIKKIDNQEVYSSSLDKTLKKWQLH